MRQLVSFCFMFLAGLIANAQTNAITAPAPKSPKTEKKFSISAILSTSTNLEEQGSYSDTTGSTLEVAPSYRLSPISSLRAVIAAQLDHTTENSKLLNTQIVLARDPIKLNEDLSLKLSAQGFLPTDKDARDASLQGAAGAIAGLQRNFAINGKESSISYSLNALKNIHEYTRDNERAANLSHRARHIVVFDVALTKKISLSADAYYQIGWTYDNVIKESYSAGQSISYQIDDHFAVSLDHSIGGKLFAADGSEWNAELFDSRKSEIGVSLMGTY